LMRKLAIGLALASTALASPALARDDQWYVGVDGGAMIVEDLDLDIGANNNAASIDADKGYDFGGVVGYDFGGFRLESEVSYREADLDTTRVSAGGIPQTAGTAVANGNFTTAGDANALSFMVNGLLDFGDDDGIQGFVGGGVGVARVDVQNILASPSWLDDSDTGFAWQALAGIRAPLSDSWDVGLKYRFFNAPGVDLVDRLGRDVSTRFRSHSIMGSLIYNFGGAPEPVEVAPPPPPPYVAPPPPPPPPPPPAPVCNTGPYIVFFDWDKSNLRPDAASVLDNAVAQYTNCGNAKVMLAGHADKSGTATYNVGLSQRRNSTVRSYLESKGVAGGAITSEAFGETAPLVQTADGEREPQNRRVEVTYGPGSGM
jgi:outer membrane protein OmpA-like peptidoglycan-associated protein